MDDGGSRHVRGIGVDNAQTDANVKLVPPSADFFFKLGKRVVVVVVRVRVRVWARPTAIFKLGKKKNQHFARTRA